MKATPKPVTSVALIGIALIAVCVCGFFLGKRFGNTQRESKIPQEQTAVDLPHTPVPQIDGGVFDSEKMREHLRELVVSSRDPHRVLKFKVAVETLDAISLKALWISLKGRLDYSDEDDFNIAAVMLKRLAELDSKTALALAEDTAAWRSQMLREVVGAWGQVDQAAALEWISKADSGVRDPALRALLELLGDRDREAAIQLFREQVAKGVVGKRAWGATDFFEEWAREDTGKAVAAALEHFRFTGKSWGLTSALEVWAGNDPKMAMAWLRQNADGLSANLRTKLTGDVLGSWSNHAPMEAADFLLTIQDANPFDAAARKIIDDWAVIGFDDAKTWISEVEDDKRRLHLEYLLVNSARRTGNRDDGIAYALERFDSNPGMAHSLYLLVSNVVGEDLEAAIPWVREIAPNDLILEEFYNTLLHQWRTHDIAQAVRHLDLMPDPIRRAEDYEFFALNYANSDLDAAREWANNLPESEDRNRALIGVSEIWSRDDPTAAAEWIQSLAPGELRDRAASIHLRQMVEDDIEGALDWASQLSNPFRRDDSLEYVMGKWLGRDRPAAEAAIRESDQLSETAKWRLLKGGDYP